MLKRLALAALAAGGLCGPAAADDAPPRVDPASYRVETIASGLDRPWSVAPLPDGRMLVTEAGGRLLAVTPGASPVPIETGPLPGAYLTAKTGLMDVAIDPDHAANGLIYLTYAYGDRDANNTRLVRAQLAGDRLDDMRVLFSATPKAGDSHFGGRLAFPRDGSMLLTLGDAFDRREDAQNPSNHLGKVVRLDRDGRAFPGNPFSAKPGAAAEIFTLGHRNVQGIAIDPEDGSALIAEHGPRGGDEVNRLIAGANYGWPVATGGLDYTFARVTPFRSLPGYEPPLVEWTPSIAPAGFAIHGGGALFPEWRGDLLAAALKEKTIRRVRIREGKAVGQETLLGELGERMRDVRVAPDGAILVLTDGEGARLLRVTPAR